MRRVINHVPLFKKKEGGDEVQGISESEITMRVTVDNETRDLKLTKKQSGALRAIAYIEGKDVFEKIINAIVADLESEPVVELNVNE